MHSVCLQDCLKPLNSQLVSAEVPAAWCQGNLQVSLTAHGLTSLVYGLARQAGRQ